MLRACIVLPAFLLACQGSNSGRGQETSAAPPAAKGSAVRSPKAICVDAKVDPDPSASELHLAREAFKERRYDQAQQLLLELGRKYPASIATRVRLADAYLFQFESGPNVAAATVRAREIYREGERLLAMGCRSSEESRYYLWMGVALAELRLGNGPNAALAMQRASAAFPDSAEVTYTLARATCAMRELERCLAAFGQTLELARSLRRPRFLRTHRSLDEWIRRSRQQSEFALLRRHPRYEATIRRALRP